MVERGTDKHEEETTHDRGQEVLHDAHSSCRRAALETVTHAERSIFVTLRRVWARQCRNAYARLFIAPYDLFDAAPTTVACALRKFERFGVITIGGDRRAGLFAGPTKYVMERDKWMSYKPTPAEAARLDKATTRRGKRKAQNHARRVQRLRDWECAKGNNDRSQLHPVKRCASAGEGTKDERADLIGSPTEARKGGKHGCKS